MVRLMCWLPPNPLAALVHSMMEVRRTDRPQVATAVVAELEALIEQHPASAPESLTNTSEFPV